ncbi:MAG: SPOCS domain-containing protein [Acutalibacteraceae bacterium]
MNIELKKENICTAKTVSEPNCVQNIDLEINLPDYCTDIKRILRCFVIPSINSVQTTGDRVSAKGDVVIRLVYIGEGEKIDCYEQSVDLSVFADVKNMPENPVVSAKAQTRFVNCRAASQRRFIVGSSVAVCFSVFCCDETAVCSGADFDGLEMKKDCIDAVGKSVIGAKTFDVSETVSLDDSKKSIGRIIGCSSFVKIESLKAVSGKVLVKGELEILITYCADTKERSIEKIVHTMPISQIVEVPGIDDTFELESELFVCALAAEAKSDSSGSDRLLETAAKISAVIKGTKQCSVSFITDCYYTKSESKAEYRTAQFLRPVGNIEKMQKVSVVPDLASQNAKNVLDVHMLSSSCSVSHSGNSLNGKGSVLLGLLFEDNKGKIQYAERNADFDFSGELKEKCDKISCKPCVHIRNLSAAVNGDKITVSFDAAVSGKVYSIILKQVLESVTADENSKKIASDAALTVYYCSKGESLWDIAKRYNTSEKSIREENELDCDFISEDRMIIIPCA